MTRDSDRTTIIRRVSKAAHYFGILLLAIGILAVSAVPFNIWQTQLDCEGGLSPVPNQGCGYVPQLVMFGQGPASLYPLIVSGVYLMYAGIAFLVIAWVASRFTQKPLKLENTTPE
jgi:hypothetical protein